MHLVIGQRRQRGIHVKEEIWCRGVAAATRSPDPAGPSTATLDLFVFLHILSLRKYFSDMEKYYGHGWVNWRNANRAETGICEWIFSPLLYTVAVIAGIWLSKKSRISPCLDTGSVLLLDTVRKIHHQFSSFHAYFTCVYSLWRFDSSLIHWFIDYIDQKSFQRSVCFLGQCLTKAVDSGSKEPKTRFWLKTLMVKIFFFHFAGTRRRKSKKKQRNLTPCREKLIFIPKQNLKIVCFRQPGGTAK